MTLSLKQSAKRRWKTKRDRRAKLTREFRKTFKVHASPFGLVRYRKHSLFEMLPDPDPSETSGVCQWLNGPLWRNKTHEIFIDENGVKLEEASEEQYRSLRE